MPSFFLRRIWNIIRGKTDSILDKMEDPEEQLSVFVADLGKQVQDLQQSVVNAIADEKRLQKQVETLRAKSDEWESRAMLALEDGNEELARGALQKQEDCDSEALALENGWKAQKEATEQLKESLKLAKTRMDEARRKYNLLLAQYKSAQTKKQIQSSLNGVGNDSPMLLMEMLEEKIASVEAEAEAQLALSAGQSDVDLETQFHAIGQRRRGDAALARLRAKLEAGEKSASGDASDDPVAALKASLDS